MTFPGSYNKFLTKSELSMQCTSLLGTGAPGWGAWSVAGTPHSSGGTSTAEVSILIF